MTPSNAATIVFAITALVLLCTGLMVFYRDYRTDALREELSSLRDRLFDVALSVRLFGDTGYAELSEQLRLSIRCADQFTFTRILLIRIRRQGQDLDDSRYLGEFAEIQSQMIRSVVNHALPGSRLFGGYAQADRILPPQCFRSVLKTMRQVGEGIHPI